MIAWGESASPRREDQLNPQVPEGRHTVYGARWRRYVAPAGLAISGRLVPGVRGLTPGYHMSRSALDPGFYIAVRMATLRPIVTLAAA